MKFRVTIIFKSSKIRMHTAKSIIEAGDTVSALDPDEIGSVIIQPLKRKRIK